MRGWNAVVATALLAMVFSSAALAEKTWTEGVNYFLVQPVRPTAVPHGKIEVTEVFSYGCPACNQFLPTMHKLAKSLPANVVITYVPAAFNPSEDWPMFQLAFCTAQLLGIAERAHDAMFDAVWKTGELAITDPATGKIKAPLPSIEDAAKFYSRQTGVAAEKFLSTAKSFAADVKVRAAEDAVMAYRVDRTPTLIVNGKYRVHAQAAGGYDELIELVKWLVAKEAG